MAEDQQTIETLNLPEQAPKALPSMLNVLTILTYIGCGISFIMGIYNYFTICASAEKLSSQEMPEMGGFLGDLMKSALEMTILSCDNRLVILVATLATTLICFLGAMMMRSLRKQGFIVYMIGELLGPLSMAVILGKVATSGFMSVFGILISLVFVILYATQRKHLVNS